MEIEIYKTEIDNLTHEQMCDYWRNGGGKAEWFDTRCEASKYFSDRLFNHFGGFTPEISKKIGWKEYK
jgi:hypothetical protein